MSTLRSYGCHDIFRYKNPVECPLYPIDSIDVLRNILPEWERFDVHYSLTFVPGQTVSRINPASQTRPAIVDFKVYIVGKTNDYPYCRLIKYTDGEINFIVQRARFFDSRILVVFVKRGLVENINKKTS